MRKCLLIFLAFLAFGCGRKEEPQYSGYDGGAALFSGSAARTPALAYDGSVSFEAAAPAFKDMNNLYGGMSDENAGSAAAGTDANGPGFITDERKIVKHANIRVRVGNLDTAEISINNVMEKYGAYTSWTSADENSRHYTIRVPSAVYNEFLAGMAGIGKVINRSESAEDVTLRYYDLEGRLGTMKELLKTFQSYLGKAKNIEEILSVERRIAELQSEIDRTGKDLRGLANDVDYSTVELVIIGPAAASISYRYPNLPERIKELFRNFVTFLSTLLIILIGIVVFGIPIALLLVFFFWLLFGKVGLMKKLWRLAADRKEADGEQDSDE